MLIVSWCDQFLNYFVDVTYNCHLMQTFLNKFNQDLKYNMHDSSNSLNVPLSFSRIISPVVLGNESGIMSLMVWVFFFKQNVNSKVFLKTTVNFFLKKCILSFSKNALNWLKVKPHNFSTRAVQLIACDCHAHLVSKTGSVIGIYQMSVRDLF